MAETYLYTVERKRLPKKPLLWYGGRGTEFIPMLTSNVKKLKTKNKCKKNNQQRKKLFFLNLFIQPPLASYRI